MHMILWYNAFKEVWLIEWPRKGVWSMVLVSSHARGEVAERLNAVTPDDQDGSEFLTVFIPKTPNPTGGYIMFLPRSDVILLDMMIEEAARLIIPTGVVVPGHWVKSAEPNIIDAA